MLDGEEYISPLTCPNELVAALLGSAPEPAV
jgi:hypothetical protein